MKNLRLVFFILTGFCLSCSDEETIRTDTTVSQSVQPDSQRSVSNEDQLTLPVNFKPGDTGVITKGQRTGYNPDIARYLVPKTFVVRGTIHNGSGTNIVLDRLTPGPLKPLYTQPINEEDVFEHYAEISYPELMQLRLPTGMIHIIARPGDTIYVEADFNDPIAYRVENSLESVQLRQMYEILEAANEKKRAWKERVKQAEVTKNNAEYIRLGQMESGVLLNIEQEKWKKLKDFVIRIDTSFVTVLAIQYMDAARNIEFLMELDDRLGNRYVMSPYYKGFTEKIEAYGPLAYNRFAPEILGETPGGKQFRLSSLKGKYVLLDFWASWCLPCKAQFPEMKRIYAKYKNKNFEILGVSLDDNKVAWLSAIQQDKLPWKQVSDLQGFKSTAATTYVVNAIPMMMLINPEGRIVAKYFHGKDLESELKNFIF
ncbi:MAG: TlpA family protein disulfide reductase [Bacteroidota bacterium]|nr:TlpA family protein disulfide reductase [Bacteroidota bacterium]